MVGRQEGTNSSGSSGGGAPAHLDLEACGADHGEVLRDGRRVRGAVAVEVLPHEVHVLGVRLVPACGVRREGGGGSMTPSLTRPLQRRAAAYPGGRRTPSPRTREEVVLHRHEPPARLQQAKCLLEGARPVDRVQRRLHVEGRVVRALLHADDVQVVLHAGRDTMMVGRRGRQAARRRGWQYLGTRLADVVAARTEVGRQAGRDFPRAIDLVLVDGEAGHVGARRGNDAAERPADAAAHVKHAVHVADLELLRHEVLRVLDRLVVRLATLADCVQEGGRRASEARREGRGSAVSQVSQPKWKESPHPYS